MIGQIENQNKKTATIDLIEIDNFHQMRMMCHQHFLDVYNYH